MSESNQADMVNHPPHYKASNGIEAIDVIEGFGLDRYFSLGNACKYLLRSPSKGRMLEDLKKCRWFIDREITRMERSEKGNAA